MLRQKREKNGTGICLVMQGKESKACPSDSLVMKEESKTCPCDFPYNALQGLVI